jgi:AAA family ATPase
LHFGGIPIQTYLDNWIQIKVKESETEASAQHKAPPARFVKLMPSGFALKDVHRNYPIKIPDEKLFEIYAKEQWVGSAVNKGDYLFDQRIIPDYAFKVIKVLPRGESMITEDTIIEVKRPAEPTPKSGLIKFNDIIGHEEVKRKCKVVMKYLHEPERFGEWAPRNILFYGPPGTGKTMTAKALANETRSTLFLVRATDLIGEYVGDGSKRIHALFKDSLKRAPSVIFIDELDAIGLDRSFQSVRGDVSEVVNALLTELGGIHENKGVVTIAATNTPRVLDVALRSRFEEEMEFKLPSKEERLGILRNYARKSPLRIKADFKVYAKRTEGFSGRDIKDKLLKTALHRAILEDSKKVTEVHLEKALKSMPSKPMPPGEMFT